MHQVIGNVDPQEPSWRGLTHLVRTPRNTQSEVAWSEFRIARLLAMDTVAFELENEKEGGHGRIGGGRIGCAHFEHAQTAHLQGTAGQTVFGRSHVRRAPSSNCSTCQPAPPRLYGFLVSFAR